MYDGTRVLVGFCGSLWGVFWVKVLRRANCGVLGFYSQLFFKGCWLLCRFLSWCSGVVCEQRNVGDGSCFCNRCDDVWGFWYTFCFCCFVDRGVSFVLVFLFISFGDIPLLRGVSYRFFGFFSLIHGCMGFPLGAPHLSFVYCYFKTSSLALIVLVKIHCDFNKFHFSFFKKIIFFLTIS